MALGLMGLLAFAGLAWMTRPLWSKAVDAGLRRRAANVAAYRQRVGELEADASAGLVDGETAATLRAELDARLLRDADADDERLASPSRSSVLATVLVVFVLGVATYGYFRDGSWRTQMQIASAPAGGTVAADGSGGSAGSLEEMVAALKTRLQTEPTDVDGWALLGRTSFMLQRYDDAAKAYAEANALTNSQEADLLTNEGESLALGRDRDLLGRPQQLFEAALKLDPQHGKSLWYAGLASEQAGDAALARTRWEALSKQELPDALRAVLNERLGAGTATAAPVASAAPAVESTTETLAAAPVADGGTSAGPVLIVAVSVADELRAQLTPDGTLFVFAKAASGPPMPLAVYRGKASELPREVRLDDSMAMTPAMKLSQFDDWIVTARVSRAGQAKAVSGDIQGSLTVARKDLGKTALALVLNEVVP